MHGIQSVGKIHEEMIYIFQAAVISNKAEFLSGMLVLMHFVNYAFILFYHMTSRLVVK